MPWRRSPPTNWACTTWAATCMSGAPTGRAPTLPHRRPTRGVHRPGPAVSTAGAAATATRGTAASPIGAATLPRTRTSISDSVSLNSSLTQDIGGLWHKKKSNYYWKIFVQDLQEAWVVGDTDIPPHWDRYDLT